MKAQTPTVLTLLLSVAYAWYPSAKFEQEHRTSRDTSELYRQAQSLANKYDHDSHRRRLDDVDDGLQFQHFVAHNETMTCSADEHSTPFNTQVRGVNLGGWMVLEPWITPSMFYQFLGGDTGSTGVDMYTFCEVLGAEEGNRQLRRHWESWVTEDIVRDLATHAHINSFRLPVGDWQFLPYGPYVDGCTEGANEYVDKLLDWAHKYNITVLLDIHTTKGSQNGFDNSGQARNMQWTSNFSSYPDGYTSTFVHWPTREANWMGDFDREKKVYPNIDHENIARHLEVIRNMVERFKDHPAVLGVEPINEPWEMTPIEELKKFYWDGYLIMKSLAPSWKYVMHDSFRFDVGLWGGFMAGCPDRALDTHIYQAWKLPSSKFAFFDDACSWKNPIAAMENAFGPVIVGEWSLATDNCAMWLNGFNDNIPGYPRLPCKYVQCTDPYMGFDQPGTPVDASKPYRGPYGTGVSGPSWGVCPVGRDWLKEHSGESSNWVDAPPEAPENRDGTDEVMTHLARRKLSAFSGIGHGFYFWNFRTDLPEPGWSYMLATERGWIPTSTFDTEHIRSACKHEDTGDYVCLSRRGVNEVFVTPQMKLAAEQLGIENTEYIDKLHGDKLFDEADILYNTYWKAHSIEGSTCDFGGTAQLQMSLDIEGDDEFSDDWIDDTNVQGLNISFVIIMGLCALVFGLFVGFVVAMKTNATFNRRVRESVVFRPIRNSAVFSSRGSLLGNDSILLLDEVERDDNLKGASYQKRGLN